MLFYFITAVRTSEIKYSIITVERRYVCKLIYCGNRQFDLRNKSNVYMHLCFAVCASRETKKCVTFLMTAIARWIIFSAVRHLITKSNRLCRWRGPIPPRARVTYCLRLQAGRVYCLQQFQLKNISIHAQKYANEPEINQDGVYYVLLLWCVRFYANMRTEDW